jgi:hypothetical protein
MSRATHQPNLLEAEQPDPDAWKEGFLARRRKAWAETPNPYHRAYYEQLLAQEEESL